MPITPLLSRFYRQLRYQLIQSRLHRVTLGLGVCLFLSSCLLIKLSIDANTSQQQALIKRYSEGLTHIAGDQLTVIVSEGNKIGMQASLNKLVERDDVINAVIYDVDNRIVVQAGDVKGVNHNREHSRSFTSPITLDDALLGSLTLTMAIPALYNKHLFLLALLSLFSFIGLLLLAAWGGQDRAAYTSSGKHNVKTKEGSGKPQERAKDYQTLLTLHLHTLDKLHQQLSAEMRSLEFKKLDTFVQKILTLYSGQLISATPQTLTFSFSSQDKTTTLFNALCSAHLMQHAAEKSQSLLRFTRFLHVIDTPIASIDMIDLKSLKIDEHEGTVVNKALIDEDLKPRLRLTLSSHPDYWYVSGFSDNYLLLLEKQLTHIL